MDNKNIFVLILAHVFTIGYAAYVFYFLYKDIVKDKMNWWEALMVFIGGLVASQLMIYVYGYYIKQIGALIFVIALMIAVYKFIEKYNIRGEEKSAAYGAIAILAIIFIVGSAFFVRTAYNQGKIFNKRQHQLEVKVKEVKKLKKSLEKKIVEVKDLRVEYGSAISDLRNEIVQEKNARGIMYYEEAIQNQRISYDLALIQRKKAYISKLDEISIRLQQGVIELEFIQRQTEDDVRLVEVLKNEKVDQIISSINDVVIKYLPDAAKLEINIDPAEMQTPRQIWNEIVESDH